MDPSTFTKRIFTLSTFAISVRDLFKHLDDLNLAFTQRRISRSFAEKIMLAVTQVNGCRYCSYAHTRLALQAGVSENELHDLLAGELSHIPPHEWTSILFAQHYAAQSDHHDAAAWQKLRDTYGSDAARDILVHIRVIIFANLYGNTFDALLERLKLRPVPDSHFFDEVVVLSAGATLVPLGLLGSLLVRRASGVFQPRKGSAHHA